MEKIKCPACWNEIDNECEICPVCGFRLHQSTYNMNNSSDLPGNNLSARQSDSQYGSQYHIQLEAARQKKRLLIIAGVLVGIFVIIGINKLENVDDDYDSYDYDNTYSYHTESSKSDYSYTYSYVASTGTECAVNRAKSYLNVSAFSYSGLVEQLEYEGFSNYEATYGADHCGADWYEQALLSAKSYLRSSAFSESGLIEQLEYTGFTSEQAKYGVSLCGADWNEQAAKSAASYMQVHDFTKYELIEQLEYTGFTHSQAVYGVESNGF